MKKRTKPISNLLTAAEAAAVGGVDLQTMRGWLDSQALPHICLDGEGRRVAIQADVLLDFLRQRRRRSLEKILST